MSACVSDQLRLRWLPYMYMYVYMSLIAMALLCYGNLAYYDHMIAMWMGSMSTGYVINHQISNTHLLPQAGPHAVLYTLTCTLINYGFIRT